MDILKKIIDCVGMIVLSATEITLETKIETLGFDDLDKLEFVMSIEDEFDIFLPEDEAEKFVTIDDVVKFVETKLKLKDK